MATLKDQTGADPRILRENGDALRPEDLEPPPEKGKEALGRLNSGAVGDVAPAKIPPEKARLKRKDFDRICSRPPVDRTRYYNLFADESPVGRARLGVSISRRVGKAVVRNRVRRRLRAAFRDNARLAAKTDVVIVARPGIDRLKHDALCTLVERSLGRASGAGAGGRAPRKDHNASDEDSADDTDSALPGSSVTSDPPVV